MSKEILKSEFEKHPLKLGDMEVRCAVLENGVRVLSRGSMEDALTIKQKGKINNTVKMPSFLGAKCLQPFIDESLRNTALNPIRYKPKRGKTALGIEATMLPKICEVWLKARDANVLNTES